ncbi:hypothetical protein P692DRAFT_20882954 [Suillus brevipes Sb2]|nr:hypothetical protein P692DRAFT_20882954 [Suillus brevipes Sb2]
MSAPSSPSSECSALAPPEYTPDPNVVNLLVRIVTARHGILHYHPQTRELSTYPWPINGRGDKIHPSQFATYRETHIFRYPCCLCAMGDTYVEASVFQLTHGVSQGDYIAECATGYCGYMLNIEKFFERSYVLTMYYPRKQTPRSNLERPARK